MVPTPPLTETSRTFLCTGKRKVQLNGGVASLHLEGATDLPILPLKDLIFLFKFLHSHHFLILEDV